MQSLSGFLRVAVIFPNSCGDGDLAAVRIRAHIEVDIAVNMTMVGGKIARAPDIGHVVVLKRAGPIAVGACPEFPILCHVSLLVPTLNGGSLSFPGKRTKNVLIIAVRGVEIKRKTSCSFKKQGGSFAFHRKFLY